MTADSAEPAAAQRRDELAAILETALDCIIVMDAEGRVQEFNPAAERTFGYRRAEMIGEEMAAKIIPPALREMHRQGLARYVATGEARILGRRIQVDAMRADGGEFPCELTITAIIRGGRPLFVAYLRDLTERKQMAQENEAAVRRWRLLFDRSPVSVQIFAPDGTTLAVNDVWERLFLASREKIIGWNVLTDQQLEASGARDTIARAFAGERVVVAPERYELAANPQLGFSGSEAASERWIGAVLYPVLDEHGKVIEVVCIHDDATERMRTERSIRELNAGLERQIAERTSELARFAAIAQTTNDFIGIADMSLRVMYINPSGRAMLGWPAAEEDGDRSVTEVYPDWAFKIVAEETIPKALRDNVWTGEMAVKHVDGHEIPVSMVGMIVRRADGSPEYMAAIMRDLSERLRIEAELQKTVARERELSRLKSSFVSMVSHEFRTPLGIILSSSEILGRYMETLDAAERQEQLGAIGDAVRRMTGLMEQVLMFSRIESGQLGFRPQPIDLEGLCTRLQDELISATGHRCPIEFLAENALEGAVADENLLRHILTNLLTNAVKYSASDQPVRFTARRAGMDAIFHIIDRGLGIPAAELENLFTAFRRARNVADLPGTGLGLVIVRKCLDTHGGEIDVQSVEGEGTTVRLTLPLFLQP